jgi:hypothetical protein
MATDTNKLNEKERMELFAQIMSEAEISEEFLQWLIGQGFFTAPASRGHHGAYEGGLFDHSYEVVKSLVEVTQKMNIEWLNPRSPYIVGMFHDLCKIDLYATNEVTGEYIHKDDNLFSGHGSKSVMLLSSWMQLTEEEVLCIRYHMGAYEKDDWEYYDRAIRKYQTVLWTHTADMVASKVKNI